MVWRYWYVDDAGDDTEILGRIQLGFADQPGTDGFAMNAADLSAGSSKVTVDDPTGDFSANGHRRFWVTETECAGDDYGGYIYDGLIRTQGISREREFVATGRTWELDLGDINDLFERPIMVGADCNRPAETDVARITWLLTTNEASWIDATTYFNTDGPVSMDAVDYRGQTFRQVVDDCMQQSGKTGFVLRTSAGVTFWYGPHGTTAFASSTKISNDVGDIDSSTVFAPASRTTMSRDPSRVYSGIYMSFANSYVYVKRQSTIDAFFTPFPGRDTASPVPNVKTATAAKARANRQLTKIATQEITISTAVVMPRSKTNDIVQGQRVQFKATHLPGFSDYLWTRVLNRTVRELAPADDDSDQVNVELALELTPDEPVPDEIGAPGGGAGATLYGILRRAAGPYTSDALVWDFAGDAPDDPGYPTQPTVGLIEPIVNVTPTNTEFPLDGWAILGDGTIDITCFVTTVGVRLRDTTYTITLGLLKNGTLFDSTVRTVAADADGFAFYSDEMTVKHDALAVSSGDLISAILVCSPSRMPYFETPWGTGQAGERLEITGGLLA